MAGIALDPHRQAAPHTDQVPASREAIARRQSSPLSAQQMANAFAEATGEASGLRRSVPPETIRGPPPSICMKCHGDTWQERAGKACPGARPRVPPYSEMGTIRISFEDREQRAAGAGLPGGPPEGPTVRRDAPVAVLAASDTARSELAEELARQTEAEADALCQMARRLSAVLQAGRARRSSAWTCRRGQDHLAAREP